MYKQGDYSLNIDSKTASDFELYMKKYPELYQNLAEIVKKNIQNKLEKPSILEIGIGPGLLSNEIKKEIPKSTIIGIDPSLNMLNIAHKRAFKTKNKKFEIILSIVENIPLKNDSIDISITRFSVSYWKNLDNGFSEIFRVLKPGGKIIIEALNAQFPIWKLKLINFHMKVNSAGKQVIKYHYDAYKTAYSIVQLEKYLQNTNFKNIKKIGNKKDWKYILIGEK